jgi:hypothetical protein
MRRQAFDLFAVENGVALHKGDFAGGLLAVVAGLGARDLVGIDDKRSVLALPDMRAQFLRLAESHPDRTDEALQFGFAPQHQHIDALVRLPVATQGPGDPPGGMLGIPRLEPRADAAFEVGNDLVGDARVNVSACCGGAHVQPSRPGLLNSDGS